MSARDPDLFPLVLVFALGCGKQEEGNAVNPPPVEPKPEPKPKPKANVTAAIEERPKERPAEARPDFTVTDQEFAKEHKTDGKAFAAKYSGKTVEVVAAVWIRRAGYHVGLERLQRKADRASRDAVYCRVPAKLNEQLRGLCAAAGDRPREVPNRHAPVSGRVRDRQTRTEPRNPEHADVVRRRVQEESRGRGGEV